MNNIEDRLRTELAELADALIERHEASSDTPGNAPAGELDLDLTNDAPLAHRPRTSKLLAIAASSLVLVGTGYLAVNSANPEVTVLAQGSVAAPNGFGTWEPIADAPIEPRPFAVTAWTGSEVVVWAGSSLTRGFAYGDGAIYQPETDSWELMDVPGWGHPGLSGAFFDGELYALAKGSGTRFDPAAGQWSDLSTVEGMFLAAAVATDDGVWGLGPAATNNAGQPDLAIAEFDRASNRWVYGPQFEGTDAQAEIVAGLGLLESTTLWTGAEIVVWRSADGGIAFDPASESWRTIAHPQPVSGLVRSSVAVERDDGMAVVAEVETTSGRAMSVAVMKENGWQWLDANIPVSDFESITVAGAGDWVVVFSADQAPVMVHLPSGEWQRSTAGPLGGVEAPNTAWTGDHLIVWGGVKADVDSVDGAKWTPPE